MVGDGTGLFELFAGLTAFATVLTALPTELETVFIALPTLVLLATGGTTVLAFAFAFEFVLLALELLAAESPQAIPIAPNVNTAESAISFFINLYFSGPNGPDVFS